MSRRRRCSSAMPASRTGRPPARGVADESERERELYSGHHLRRGRRPLNHFLGIVMHNSTKKMAIDYERLGPPVPGLRRYRQLPAYISNFCQKSKAQREGESVIRMESMKNIRRILVLLVLAAMAGSLSARASGGSITKEAWQTVRRVNEEGPYLGLVVPNSFELNPLLQSPNFVRSPRLPFLDLAGRRFRFGTVGKEKVIVVMTGLSMLNAGLSTQLLLTLFDIKGVVHFGIAGNANSDLQIGDVTIPRQWAHTGLWNWQRYGDGPNDELALEAAGDYTRRIGYLNFSDYDAIKEGNFLNSVWYQPEEIFPANGVPEVRQHAFWVSVSKNYYALSKNLEGLRLPQCINSTCLSRRPKALRVEKGCSANAFVDNAGYRQFLRTKFDVTPIDMESAAVALVCRQELVPFITFRALSDLAGGGSSQSNEAAVFSSLAAQNAVDVVIEFINLLH